MDKMRNKQTIEIHFSQMNESSIFFIQDADVFCIKRLFAPFNPTSKVLITGIEAIDRYDTTLRKSNEFHLFNQNGTLYGDRFSEFTFRPESTTDNYATPTEVNNIFAQTYTVGEFTEYIQKETSLKAIIGISAIIDDKINYRTLLTGLELRIPNNKLENFKHDLFEKYPKYTPIFDMSEKNPECYILFKNGTPKLTLHGVENVNSWILREDGELKLRELLYDEYEPF